VNEGKFDPELALEAPCRLELAIGQIETDNVGASTSQPGRPVSRTAAEFDHFLPGYVAQDADVALGNF
jgi:hypothetical protein